MAGRKFDWQTWIDGEREAAAIRVAMQGVKAESDAWDLTLVADLRYAAALELWSRHSQALAAVAETEAAVRRF